MFIAKYLCIAKSLKLRLERIISLMSLNCLFINQSL